ncbi:aldehyde dehydrogenase family protein [Streptomyces bobili]|uniref:aldehyde dehydrogenase family protein n=1 Tax=Streptomyces bobili TaxID=67280 RepID=UPI00225B6A2B|nr:aldehyde dehydrogenase family protein [Streptomyces bobili]MCX5522325.1 aldehyde dehydrogenase family protein [Streptomyces bobili]
MPIGPGGYAHPQGTTSADVRRRSPRSGCSLPACVSRRADTTHLDGAAKAAATAILINSGQVCSATTRLLVERSVQDELVRRIGAILESRQPAQDFGPIITAPQFDKVLAMLDTARQEGAHVAVGGHTYEEGVPERGLYVQPTVLTEVKPDMQAAREEFFGPVLVAMPFDTADEAVTLANDAERKERARIRSEKGIRWGGRPLKTAA